MKNAIETKILSVLDNDEYEVLWYILQPKHLPRGYSNIIAGVLYHPPGANNTEVKEHLKSSLETIETCYPNSGIVLAGDFQLRSQVHFPFCHWNGGKGPGVG